MCEHVVQVRQYEIQVCNRAVCTVCLEVRAPAAPRDHTPVRTRLRDCHDVMARVCMGTLITRWHFCLCHSAAVGAASRKWLHGVLLLKEWRTNCRNYTEETKRHAGYSFTEEEGPSFWLGGPTWHLHGQGHAQYAYVHFSGICDKTSWNF